MSANLAPHIQEIQQMFAAGALTLQVAIKYRCTVDDILELIHRHGIKTRQAAKPAPSKPYIRKGARRHSTSAMK